MPIERRRKPFLIIIITISDLNLRLIDPHLWTVNKIMTSLNSVAELKVRGVRDTFQTVKAVPYNQYLKCGGKGKPG